MKRGEECYHIDTGEIGRMIGVTLIGKISHIEVMNSFGNFYLWTLGKVKKV